MPPAQDPGVSDPPPEPATPVAPAPNEPSGGDPVTSSGEGKEQTVPFSRFKEVNDKAKQHEEQIAQLQSDIESLRTPASTTSEEEIDPEVLDLVRKSADKLGFISKEEFDKRETQNQVRQDINDLASQYKQSGIPFDGEAVIKYATDNGMPIGSKKSLDAVYKEMNYEAIIEANRKAAIESYQKGLKSGGEKPGSKGSQLPQEPKPANLKERIKQAREGVGYSLN